MGHSGYFIAAVWGLDHGFKRRASMVLALLSVLKHSYTHTREKQSKFCIEKCCTVMVSVVLFYHRIMEWFGEVPKAHPVPTPCPRQGHFLLEQVAPSPVQPALEPFQGIVLLDNLATCN